MMKHLFIVALLFPVLSLAQSSQSFLWSNGKVIVSENKHFLQFENGTPFFWLGDTGWLLFQKLNREEAKQYLKNRHEKEFNVIQCMVIHDVHEKNCYGSNAFAADDSTSPNIASDDSTNYWNHVEWVVDEAARNGLYIALVPVWGGVVKQGFFSAATAERYAAFLAERFKSKPNIFWIVGGDLQGNIKNEIWETIGTTVKKHDPNHLITYHPYGRTQSSQWFHNSEWLDFNMFQSGHRTYEQDDSPKKFGEDNWKYVRDDYSKLPLKPTLDGEPSYEGIPHGLHDTTQPYWTASDIRRYAYWSVFAGGCGFTYGNNSVMQMNKPADKHPAYGAREYWYQAIDDSGAFQMKYLKQLMLSHLYFDRMYDDSLVAGDAGKRYDYVIAARGKNYVLAYDFTGRTFALSMGRISGDSVNASWFNPRNGETTSIGVLMNAGIATFDPPGEKANGNDWVLVLDGIDREQ
jgi:hypothetical protein